MSSANKSITPGLAYATDRLLLFVFLSVFARCWPKTSSRGTFSPRVLCNLAIFHRFSLSVRPWLGSPEDVVGEMGDLKSAMVYEREWDWLIGERGPMTESTLSLLRSAGVRKGLTTGATGDVPVWGDCLTGMARSLNNKG